jgi:hypothetical protein
MRGGVRSLPDCTAKAEELVSFVILLPTLDEGILSLSLPYFRLYVESL